MNCKMCEKGHVYDGSLAACPFCEAEAAGEIPRTMGAANEGFPGGFPEIKIDREGIDSIPNTTPTVPPDMSNRFTNIPSPDKTAPNVQSGEFDSYRVTQAVHINGNNDCDPIVGWLVCIKGPNRGKDYRLHSGANFIGRSKNMDICIENDITISANRHASISYDDRTKAFFIEKGEVRNLIYVNNVAVRQDIDLKIYDKIEIGNTMLIFIPLCSDSFNWQEY